jgi:hypothetical protein
MYDEFQENSIDLIISVIKNLDFCRDKNFNLCSEKLPTEQAMNLGFSE